MQYRTLPVIRFMICDEDEGLHKSDNDQDFESTDELLNKLRTENPDTTYTMIAEIDA